MSKRLLLINTGTAIKAAIERGCSFAHLFGTAMHLSESQLEVVQYQDVDEDHPPFDLDGIAGVVMSGSRAMVDENKPWMRFCCKEIQRIIDAEIPFFGVCFGHQLLAHTLGGKVAPNPKGRFVGTVAVSPQGTLPQLIGGRAESFNANVSHRDVVTALGPNLRAIGTAPHDPHHIIQHNERTFGVQFHPEFTRDVSELYINQREAMLTEECGVHRYRSWLDGLEETPISQSMLRHFATGCLSE